MKKTSAFWALAALGALAVSAGADEVWSKVQAILSGTRDIVVLDGTTPAPLRQPKGAAPEYGDWMVEHMLSDPENLNPYTSTDAGASSIHRFVFESLLYPDNEPPYALKGLVAKAYPTISADKLSYTFELRPDVKFADGHPLTAADVLFSMKVIQNPQVMAAHLRNYYEAVKDVRLDGEYRITFLCSEPYFRNDMMLGGFEILPRHFYDPEGLMAPVPLRSLVDGSWEQGPNAAAVKKFAEQFNQNFNRKLMGSGPYLIADPERDVVTQQKVVLTRSANYWGKGKEGLPPTGYVDKIVFKIINNMDAAFIELTNGQLDMHTLQPLEFKEKSWSSDFNQRFLKGIEYSSGYAYVGWNNQHPIFRDKLVRQAMTCLTNREEMIRSLLFGLGETIESPIHKFRPEYNNNLKPYPYSPERAAELLTQAGWSDSDGDGILDKNIDGKQTPFSFEILVNSGNQLRKDVALILQNELKDAGINCQVRELDWSILLQRVKGQDFAAVVLGWTGSMRFPPDNYQIWHSSQSAGRGSNHIGFANAEVDKILEDYRREFDPKKRIAMYQRYQEILHEEQPYTFLWMSRLARAYSRRFQGVNWYPMGADTQEWWVRTADRMYN
ncbi:MAG: peptide-binding protein [Candidatus Latescibacteria bacterium]|nr:peptide-binding protein [Candidatus Latescibacterota bacterium]